MSTETCSQTLPYSIISTVHYLKTAFFLCLLLCKLQDFLHVKLMLCSFQWLSSHFKVNYSFDFRSSNKPLKYMVPKLSGACYAVRSLYHISNINTLKSIYFAFFHSIIKYGIIFWGNSSNRKKIFTLQKKIIRIVVGAQPRTTCRSLFKKLEILPVSCQ
jgi:hypothetical protein